jgi:hypothetical protein
VTVLGIFGDKDAPALLVTAALNDMLEAHLVDHEGEDFWLCVGVRKPLAIYQTIIGWALHNGLYVAVYTKFSTPSWEAVFGNGEFEVAEWHHSDRWMLDVVERLSAEHNATIYALMGDEDPPVDVRRALVRALDSGLEVRDLAEAGLTYVGVADNPIRQGSNTMAKEEMTLEQAGELADEGDAESIQALVDLAERFELDPDDYPTWVELGTVLDPLLAEAEAEAEGGEGEGGEAEPDDEAPRRNRGGNISAEDLEEKSVPELRQLAKQLGVDGWEKNRSAKLIEGILEAQGNGDGPPRKAASAADDDSLLATLARAFRAFAEVLEG